MNIHSDCGKLLAICAALLVPAMAFAASITVDAASNIFGAGHAVAPAPGGLGPGMLPPSYSFTPTPNQLLSFSSVVGQISYNNGFSYWGPDGYDPWLFGQTFPSYGGISGIVTNSYEFLAGVFLDDNEPIDPAPASLNFGPEGMTRNFTSVAPAIGQLFFVGDGLADSGAVQQFHVPSTATRLFLGFIDVDQNFSPGLYLDNVGSVQATFDSTTVPEPVTMSLLAAGLIPLCRLRRYKARLSRDSFRMEARGNPLDVNLRSLEKCNAHL